MAMLCDTGGHFRMCQLHEQCPAAREESNHFSVYLPDHRIGREESFVTDRKCFIWHRLRRITYSTQLKKAYRIPPAGQVAMIASDESNLVTYSTTRCSRAVDSKLLFDRRFRKRVS